MGWAGAVPHLSKGGTPSNCFWLLHGKAGPASDHSSQLRQCHCWAPKWVRVGPPYPVLNIELKGKKWVGAWQAIATSQPLLPGLLQQSEIQWLELGEGNFLTQPGLSDTKFMLAVSFLK